MSFQGLKSIKSFYKKGNLFKHFLSRKCCFETFLFTNFLVMLFKNNLLVIYHDATQLLICRMLNYNFNVQIVQPKDLAKSGFCYLLF